MKTEEKNIRLSIVDDHEIFLRGIEGILRNEFLIQQTFTSGNSLLEGLPLQDTDVLLLDLQLPDIEPEVLLRKIRKLQPDLKILYLTLVRGNRHYNKLKPLGLQGYILKDSPVEMLKEAILTVASGEEYFGDRYQTSQQNTVTTPENKIKNLLSKRELEVLKLVAQEYSSAQIAEQLFLSVSTVDSHRKNIMIKLGVDNIVGLIKVAVQNGLI
ncbi:LuxR C-terminal-related transcriptional regulator [Jiulongibacter sp. NS-SX5]|uniref:LuxR C-terminal-related transcriptional regulator n=1 Tax=Jiulongibacter sp. NS-SX5 TaxID=3463854 RepID=UPI0040581DB5